MKPETLLAAQDRFSLAIEVFGSSSSMFQSEMGQLGNCRNKRGAEFVREVVV